MADLSDEIPIPPKDQMNTNLSPATESTMILVFGRPGALTQECSDPTGEFTRRIRYEVDVGPFRASGLDFALERLLQLFSEVKNMYPAVFAQVKTAGMLCVRFRRVNLSKFSNHSWGTAIDIYFGSGVVPQGKPVSHRGNLILAPYFNKYGWYWAGRVLRRFRR